MKRLKSIAAQHALKKLGERAAPDKCTFYFVSASKIRSLDALPAEHASLPSFQQLRARGDGWLVDREMHLMTRRNDGAVVSRWWEHNRHLTWLAISHR